MSFKEVAVVQIKKSEPRWWQEVRVVEWLTMLCLLVVLILVALTIFNVKIGDLISSETEPATSTVPNKSDKEIMRRITQFKE